MYCEKCGSKINEDSVFRSECGYNLKSNNNIVVENEGSEAFCFGLLGFFCPFAGLVLYLVWKDTKPKSSKYAGIGALINVGLSLFLILLYIILIFFAFAVTL